MTTDIAIVLGIILLAVYLFVTEKMPVDVVSVLVMSVLMLTGILTPAEGFSGFSNSATITVGAMFVISASVFKTGALNNIGLFLTRLGRKNYLLCLVATMGIAGLLSAFINDTAVVALMMPVVIQVAKDAGISPSKLLMPLSFSALLGGACTLIGTSTNILVSSIAVRQGEKAFEMFELTPVGIWLLAAGLIYLLFIGRRLLPNRASGEDLTTEFDMGDYLTEVIILPGSESIGKPLNKSRLIKDIDIEVIEITRGTDRFRPAPDFLLQPGDHLRVRGDVHKLRKLKIQEGIEIVSGKKISDTDFESKETRLVKGIVTPKSDMDGKCLKEISFRSIYGASVLAIRHRDEILHERIAEAKLCPGDVLLISADEKQIRKLRESSDLLLTSEFQVARFNFEKIIPTLMVIAGIIVTASAGLLPIVLSATVGALLLILMKSITPEEAYKSIEWKVIFMLAGLLSMGMALEKTGAASLIATILLNSIGSWGPHIVLGVFFFMTFLSTNFMSNNATAALLAPIAIITANNLAVSPRPFLMAVTYAASLSFMTPLGYQTNTIFR